MYVIAHGTLSLTFTETLERLTADGPKGRSLKTPLEEVGFKVVGFKVAGYSSNSTEDY